MLSESRLKRRTVTALLILRWILWTEKFWPLKSFSKKSFMGYLFLSNLEQVKQGVLEDQNDHVDRISLCKYARERVHHWELDISLFLSGMWFDVNVLIEANISVEDRQAASMCCQGCNHLCWDQPANTVRRLHSRSSPPETSLPARSKERGLYSRAKLGHDIHSQSDESKFLNPLLLKSILNT